jgi:hypothetical protein
MMSPGDGLEEHVSTVIAVVNQMIDFEASAADTSIELALRVAKFLRDGPRLNEKACRWADAHGALVRTILRTVLRAAEHGYSEFASVGAVLRCISREFQALGIARGMESLEAHWRKYRSVSHLWAAMDEFTFTDLSQAALLQFLARAEDLRHRGEAYKHPQASAPILDRRLTWKVPNGLPLPPATVSLPPLSDDELDVLKNSTG